MSFTCAPTARPSNSGIAVETPSSFYAPVVSIGAGRERNPCSHAWPTESKRVMERLTASSRDVTGAL